ncbi:MAG TPA: ATP-binding protein [Opitutaceae bacterium]|nr:ATP-binding protein [Opitutaceae bacterium]
MENAVADIDQTGAERPPSLEQKILARQLESVAAEEVALDSLIYQGDSVPYDLPLEDVQRVFRGQAADFLALVRQDRVTGLCSRGRLGRLLGSRYGFSLYSQGPAHLAQVEHPLVFEQGTPLRAVLAGALARHGEEFHEDVVLVDREHRLLGLISAEALAHVQTRLVAEQVEKLRRQNLELIQANDASRRSQGLWQGLFESHLLGVALLDPRGRIQVHNLRCAELLNLEPGQPDGLDISALVPERERPAMAELLARHVAASPVLRDQTLMVPGRGLRSFRFAAEWIAETGQVCVCLDDVTEQRALEGRMKQREKQMLFETLVAGIAHELNNKLTPVLGFAELLGVCTDPLARQSYTKCISKSVMEAATIIRQLLQLSRPENTCRQAIDLREVVNESLIMLKFLARECGAEISTKLPAEPVFIQADSAQIKQVIINLAINALHAMEPVADPRLEIAVGRGDGCGLITVTDNGVGIAPEIIGRIFDPFFTTKSPDRGSGLGLSVCLGIVRQHDGAITVESEPGKGACFAVTFPLAVEGRALVARVAEEMPVAEKTPAAARSAEPARFWRVLVVEDEEGVRMLLRELLVMRFNCQVDTAGDGAQALGLAGAGRYDLIVSDIRMPEMSGTEFYRRLREVRPELAGHFVFVTGHAGERELEEEIARWNVPLVKKPFSMARLADVCQPFLTRPTAA